MATQRQLDHLRKINDMRKEKTTCKRGHKLETKSNGKRYCRECKRLGKMYGSAKNIPAG